MERINAQLSRLEDILHVIGCLALVVIALLINADILLRLLFKTPVQFQFEFVEFYMMPMVASLSLARVFRNNGHLALEFVHPEAFGRLKTLIRTLMLASAAGFFAVVTYMSGRFSADAFAGGDVYFGYIDWPLGWAYLAVPVGTGVLTVRLAFEIIRRGDEIAPLQH